MKYDLPSVRENIDNISEAIFSILHKYAAAGLSKGENFDLVVSAFKASTAIGAYQKYSLRLVPQKSLLLCISDLSSRFAMCK